MWYMTSFSTFTLSFPIAATSKTKMPRTRAQSKLEEHFEAPEQDAKAGEKRDAPAEDSAKPEVAEAKDESAEEPPTKKQKIEEEGADAQEDMKAKPEEQASYDFQSGIIPKCM